LKFAAVTGLPLLNFRPARIWKTSLFPWWEIVGKAFAACGMSFVPAVPAFDGKLSSVSSVL